MSDALVVVPPGQPRRGVRFEDSPANYSATNRLKKMLGFERCEPLETRLHALHGQFRTEQLLCHCREMFEH